MRNPDADSMVAFCCAHYPRSCDFYGFALNWANAHRQTIRHWWGVHR